MGLLDYFRQLGGNLKDSGKQVAAWTQDPQSLIDYLQQPRYSKDEAIQKVMDFGNAFAPGAAGGVGVIKAWHGSPSAFERFDMSKIGTGEGAQAYGHGLYFADSKGVAKSYADSLSEAAGKFRYQGNDITDLDLIAGMAKELAGKHNRDATELMPMMNNIVSGIQVGDKLDDLAKFVRKSDWDFSEKQLYEDAIGLARNIQYEAPTPQLYNVDLKWPDAAKEAADPLGPQHMLDLDAYYYDQPKFIKNALQPEADLYRNSDGMQGAYITASTGRQLLDEMSKAYGGPEGARKRMADLGIPGSRYLDAGSRADGAGTSNYVIFDDQIPEIVTRNGMSLIDLLRGR